MWLRITVKSYLESQTQSPHLPTLHPVLTGEDGGRVEVLEEQLCWWYTNTKPSQLCESFQIYLKEQKASDLVQFNSVHSVVSDSLQPHGL